MNSPYKKNPLNESEFVKSKKISCSGDGGVLGHPKIYLDIGKENQIICPYCSKIFIFKN
jgi:uncharacterized Zn-finger protein